MSMSDRPQLAAPTQPLLLVIGAASDAGGRDANQDAVFIGDLVPAAGNTAEDRYLLAVADGMGGHARGEAASQIAIDTLVRLVNDDPGADTALMLKQAFRRANDAIYEESSRNDAGQVMGTTLVAAVLHGQYATIASIGDSRAYLVRANALTQITKDHSLVAEQVSRGALTSRQAQESPHRNILIHALGHKPKLDTTLPGIFEITLLPEDRLLLCSDGFYDVVENQDIVRILLAQKPDDAAKQLVDLAVERGTTDNVSAVVAEAIPTRVSQLEREPATAAAGRGPFGAALVPILVTVAAIVFIAIVLFALTLL